jgi:hypothetical protein
MAEDRRLIDRVTAPSYVEGLDDLPPAVLLERIETCGRVVLESSYVRRLLQGRIDILDAVLGGAADPAAILAAVLGRPADEAPNVRFRRSHLLELLRDRLPPEMHGIAGILFPAEPPIRAPEWLPASGRREVDRVLDDDLLSRLGEAREDEVLAARRRLVTVEREVSANRRRVLAAADVLERAAVRRLKGPMDAGETLRIIEWMCDAYVRHRAAAGP